MYKRITLKKIERREYCTLDAVAFNAIKDDIEHHIDVLNKGIADDRDYILDSYMQAYHNILEGMKIVCSNIGITIKISYLT